MKNIILPLLILLLSVACDETTTSNNSCGDGVLDVGEECDGDNLGGQYCQVLGFYSGNLLCNDDCTLNIQSCQAGGFCGDSVIQRDNEICDGPALLEESCEDLGYPGGQLVCGETCRYNISGCEGADLCGNGTVDAPEECDGDEINGGLCSDFEGMVGGTLGCGIDCRYDLSLCYGPAICGDNTIQEHEQCDGNNLQGQSCITLGFDGGLLSCNSQCRFDTGQCEGDGGCGDGILQANEDCDNMELNGESCQTMGFATGM
ncbi:hypothetical protein KKF84_15100, partial [Myxococcota bacterium]|nr:hypothetical protein [Myxococcota bacterium]